MNKSGLEPRGAAVIVKPYEIKSDTIELPSTVKSRSDMIEQKAVVVAIGPEAWKDESQPRAKVGEHVLISKYAGYLAQGDDGEAYRVINGSDIFAARTPESVAGDARG